VTVSDIPISGHRGDGFAAVRAGFERNFAERGEVGAAGGGPWPDRLE